MGDDQRHGLRMRRAHVQEVNGQIVDVGRELREAIELRLAPAPVIFLGPIAADLLDPFERHALAPVADQLGLGPAGVAQSRPEVVEDIVADGDAIRLDCGCHDTTSTDRRCFARRPIIYLPYQANARRNVAHGMLCCPTPTTVPASHAPSLPALVDLRPTWFFGNGKLPLNEGARRSRRVTRTWFGVR